MPSDARIPHAIQPSCGGTSDPSGMEQRLCTQQNRPDRYGEIRWDTGTGYGNCPQSPRSVRKIRRKNAQIALAWEWAKGVASPIIGATKASHFDDAAGAFSVKLTGEDIEFLEEPYIPHRIVGAINANPPEGVKLLDVKK